MNSVRNKEGNAAEPELLRFLTPFYGDWKPLAVHRGLIPGGPVWGRRGESVPVPARTGPSARPDPHVENAPPAVRAYGRIGAMRLADVE